MVNALIDDLDKAQPGQVPAPVRGRVVAHQHLRMCEHVAAEGVVRRQPAQLRKHLVAADVVGPRGRHGALEGARVGLGLAAGGGALDPAQLRQRVDAVCLERLDQLADRLLFCSRAEVSVSDTT